MRRSKKSKAEGSGKKMLENEDYKEERRIVGRQKEDEKGKQ